MGNICRSPAAEGILKNILKKHRLEDEVYVESAGTSGHHVGDPPDERMQAHAKKRNVNLESVAQRFHPDFFTKFDLIITMDRANHRHISALDIKGEFKNKIVPFANYCMQLSITEVPDPYYGGTEGFEEVLDICEDGCRGLLDRLEILKYE